MGEPIRAVEEELEERLQALDYDLVDVEWAGSRDRPIIRLRVDHLEPDLEEREGVTVDECAEVSRALEPWLDELDEVPERYTLEVSSPGVDRPLKRTRDFLRFMGHEIAVKGPEVLADRATYLEGELVGLEEEPEGSGSIYLRLPGGEELKIPRDEISGAHLLFRWK
ncbi:MAG: ribosome maturation factor RimP [Longimicrobiales bacterium]|nr:ribosome maturation factor RimP [Longimicrobiales bacterium]